MLLLVLFCFLANSPLFYGEFDRNRAENETKREKGKKRKKKAFVSQLDPDCTAFFLDKVDQRTE